MIDDTKKKATTAPINDPEIKDIDLGYVERQKFRIGGDYNRILELNVSDMNIYSRFTQAYPKLQEFAKEAQKKVESIPADKVESEDVDLDSLDKIGVFLTDIDTEMRKLIDFIFDTNASEVCAPSGNMFDPVEGRFRYDRIIDVLSNLYTTGFNEQIKKFENKVSKHTDKYTKKYHK